MIVDKEYIPTPDELRSRIGARKVFIWGARHDGYAAYLVFRRNAIEIDFFVDSSLSLQGAKIFGVDVHLPQFLFENFTPDNAFIIIASGFHADEIAEECMRYGFQAQRDFVIQGELRRFNYQVDISGSCNLKCISCPRGNFDEHRSTGFMKADTYRLLLEKIIQDDPYTGIISLYNWGEPLLNRALPDIVRITNEHSILSAISSNLSFKLDFEEVVAAKPTWFRISTSGWGSSYEVTHTGGKWDLLYNNVLRLKEYQDKYHPEMIVEVFYHIYEHNRDDYIKWQALCDQLGFVLRCRHAALAPLDNIQSILDGHPVNSRVEQTQSLQFLKVDEVMAKAYAERHRPCYYERHLWITWDLNVAQCMEWYRPGLNLVEESFMNVTPEELIKARDESVFCTECKSKGIHRCFVVYSEEKLINERGSVPLNTVSA